MVRMCACRVSLMSSIIEAMVVDFPEPVGPVTKIMPLCRLAISRMTEGSRSSSKDGMRFGIMRRAPATAFRCV